MSRPRSVFGFLAVLLLSGTAPLRADAATIQSLNSGYWDVGTTWVGGVVPGLGDDVEILNGNIVSVRDNQASAGNLTIQAGGEVDLDGSATSAQLGIYTGGALTVYGTLKAANDLHPLTLQGSGGFFTYSGNWMDMNGKNVQFNQMDCTSSAVVGSGDTFTLGGDCRLDDLTVNTGGSVVVSGGIKLVIRHAMSIAGGTFTNGGIYSTVEFLTSGTTLRSGGQTLGVVQTGGGSTTLTLLDDLSCLAFGVAAGDTVYLQGYELASAGAVTVSGTLDATDGGAGSEGDGSIISVGGDWTTNSGAAFIRSQSLVRFDGGAGNYTVTTNGTFFHDLEVNGGGSWTEGDVLNVEGTLNIVSGVLDTSAYSRALTVGKFTQSGGQLSGNGSTISVLGDWSRSGGTFSAGTSIVDFASSGPSTVHITGSTSFAGLAASGTSRTVVFEAGSAQSVSSGLNLQSVSLVSSSPGTRWGLTSSAGSVTISNISVADSDASAGNWILAAGNTDGGNNLHWWFSTPTPDGLGLSNPTMSGLDASWNATSPAGESYTVVLSPNSDMSSPVASHTDTGTSYAFTSLSLNTRYYAQVHATLAGQDGSPGSIVSLATLANTPGTNGSPSYNYTDATISWSNNGNPAGTDYYVQIAYDSGFNSIAQYATTQNTSYQFTGLSESTQYYSRVSALNLDGVASGAVDTGGFKTNCLASTPNNPSFSSVSDTALQFNWGNGGTAESYYLRIDDDSGFNSPAVSETTTALYRYVTGLQPSTRYYVDVYATACGNNSTSLTANVATLAATPAFTSGPSVGYSDVTLYWGANGNPGGTDYIVELASDSGFTSIVQSQVTQGTQLQLISLGEGTNYYARVRARNPDSIETSNLDFGSFRTNCTPSTPINGGFSSVSDSAFQFDWTNGGTADSFNIRIDDDPSFSTPLVSENTISTSRSVSSLSPNTRYYVDVTATACGNNSGSLTGNVATLAHAPAASGSPTINSSDITAYWDANGNPSGTEYIAEIASDSGFTNIRQQQVTTANQYQFTSLTPGDYYYIRVRARNQDNIETSNLDMGSYRTACTPAAPTGGSFSSLTETSLQFDWTNGGLTDNYVIRIDDDSGFTSPIVNESIGSTSRYLSGLSPDTRYYVDVFAQACGNDSSSVGGNVATYANAPTGGSLNAGLTDITAGWNANGNPSDTTYVAELATDSGFGSIVQTQTVQTTSAQFTTLSSGAGYYARVHAVNRDGQSTGTLDLGYIRTDCTPTVPTAPGFTSVTQTTARFQWTSGGTEDFFELSLDDNNMFSSPDFTGTTSATYIDLFGLTPNTRYYGQVAANACGHTSASVTANVLLPAATPLYSSAPSAMSRDITVYWDAAGNPAGTDYVVELAADAGYTNVLRTDVEQATSHYFGGLASGTAYFVRVRARDLDGNETPNLDFGQVATSADSITATGDGEWTSQSPNAPWPNGIVPDAGTSVTIPSGVTVTIAHPAVAANLTVENGGVVNFDASADAATLTLYSGGAVTNGGTIRILNDTLSARLNSSGGPGAFYGTPIDLNGRKLFLGGFSYEAPLFIGANETVELTGDTSLVELTVTDPTGQFRMGGSANLTLHGSITLPSTGNTFVRSTGGGRVALLGDFPITTYSRDLGSVVVGASPDTITLLTDFTATSLTINAGDILQTNGYELTVTGDIVNAGTLDTRDNLYSGFEGNASSITVGGSFLNNAGSTFVLDANVKVLFNGTAAGNLIRSSGQSFPEITFNGSGGGWTLRDALRTTGGADVIVTTGALNIAGQNVSVGHSFTYTNGLVTNATGSFTVGGTYRQDASSMNGGAGPWTVASFDLNGGSFLAPSSSMTVRLGVDLTGSGAFLHNGGTLYLTNGASASFLAQGATFYDLILDHQSETGPGMSATLTWTGDCRVAHDLTIEDTDPNAGGFTVAATGSPVIRVGNNVSLSDTAGSGVFAFGPNALSVVLDGATGSFFMTDPGATFGATLTFAGTGTQAFDPEAGSLSGDLVIDKVSGVVRQDAAVFLARSAGSFTIVRGVYDLNGFDLNYAAASTFSNNGIVRLHGDENVGVANDADSGEIEYTGTASYPGSLPFGNDYWRLRFNGTGSWTFNGDVTVHDTLAIDTGTFVVSGQFNASTTTLAGGVLDVQAFDITNTLTIVDGAFQANAVAGTMQNLVQSGGTLQSPRGETLTVRGNWERSGGDYFQNSGTFLFYGAVSHHYAGTSQFNLFEALTPGATIAFEPDSVLFVGDSVAIASTTLKSAVDGQSWNYNFGGFLQSIVSSRIQDSHAQGGFSGLADSDSVDLGGNVNWIFGSDAPANLRFTAATPTSLSFAWDAIDPLVQQNAFPPIVYRLEVSDTPDFSGTVLSSSTVNLTASFSGLPVNTVYYSRIKSSLAGEGPFSATISSSTAANPPTGLGSSNVTQRHLTLNWNINGNPAGTVYDVDLSSVGDFSSGVQSRQVTVDSTTFNSLDPGTTYYARVRGVAFSGLPTGYATTSVVTLSGPVVRYWVSVSGGAWEDPANWSTSSCGGGGAGAPEVDDIAVLDGACGANGDATLNQMVQVATVSVSGYTGTVLAGSNSILVSKTFEQTSGTMNSVGNLYVGENLLISGGSINPVTLYLSPATSGRLNAPNTIFGSASVGAGTQLNLESNVTSEEFWASGTIFGQGHTVTASKEVHLNSTFFPQGGGLVLNGASPQDLDPNGAILNNVTIAAPSVHLLTDLNVAGALDIQPGAALFAFDGNSTTARDVRVDGGFTNAGEFHIGVSTLSLAGGTSFVTSGGGSFLIDQVPGYGLHIIRSTDTAPVTVVGGPTLFDATDNALIFDHVIWEGDLTLRNGSSLLLYSDSTLNGSFTMDGGSVGTGLNIGSGRTLSLTGDFLVNGTVNNSLVTAGTLNFKGATPQSLETAGLTAPRILHSGSGDLTVSVTGLTTDLLTLGSGSGTVTVTGSLVVSSVTIVGGSLDVQGFTVSSLLAVQGGGFQANMAPGTVHNFLQTGGSVTSVGNDVLSVTGDWDRTGGSFFAAGGTVSFDGAVSHHYSGSTNFNMVRALTEGATMAFEPGSVFGATDGVHFASTTLRSVVDGQTWGYAFTGFAQTIERCRIKDSDASGFLSGFASADSEDLGGNINWIFGSLPPQNLHVTSVSPTTVSFAWDAIDPLIGQNSLPPIGYRVDVSSAADFSGTIFSSSTPMLQAVVPALQVNTTYYARILSTLAGEGPFSATISSGTTANPPTAGTWSGVGALQLTLDWSANGNPAGTHYVVEVSSVSGFASGVRSQQVDAVSATFTGLAPSTVYYGRVQALAHSGSRTSHLVFSSTQTSPTVPPSGLAVTGVTTTQLSAAWSPSSPAGDSYTFEVSSASDFTGARVSSVTADVTATVSPLNPNTTYYGHVRATVGGVDSAWSAAVSSATDANVPTAAAWTSAGSQSVTVNWAPNGNPAGSVYRLEVSSVAGFASAVSGTNTTALSASVGGLVPDTVYFARVQTLAFNGSRSGYTVLTSTRTGQIAAPSGLAFSGSSLTSLAVTWTPSSPAGDRYLLELNPASDFSGVGVTSDTANSQATIAGLSANTTYYARVRASVLGAVSAWSVSASSGTQANAPTNSQWTTVTPQSVTLSWLGGGNPAGTLYQVEVTTDTAFASAVIVRQTTSLTSTISGLLPDSVYYGRVKAIAHTGANTPYDVLASTRTSPVASPSGLSFSASTASSLTGAWSASTPAGDTYTLELNTLSNFTGVAVTSTTALTSATISGLSVNTTYYGRVKSTVSGVDSPWSATVSSGTPANPPVSDVWSGVSAQAVTLNWNGNGNPVGTHYRVEISSVAGFASAVLSTQASSLSAGFTGLVPNTVYFGRVKALAHNGASTPYLVFSSTRTSPIAAPAALAFTASDVSSLAATWSASAPAGDTYTLEVNTLSNFTGVSFTSTTVLTSATVSGLSANTTYYGRVLATVAGANSAWSVTASSGTPANPPTTGTWSGVSASAVTLNWSSNGNPAGTRYRIEISSVAGFASDVLAADATTLSATFSGLLPSTVYFGRVKAVAHSGAETAYLVFSSSRTSPAGGPANLTFTASTNASLAASWLPSVPAGDIYTLELDDNNDFSSVTASSVTANLSASLAGLQANTTYYGRVKSRIGGVDSEWSQTVASGTLANIPTGGSWAGVGAQGVTVNWAANGNPAGTHYRVEISSVPGFAAAIIDTQSDAVSATVNGLIPNVDYVARVKALSHSGASTPYLVLASTRTSQIVAPSALNFTGATSSALSAAWTASSPAATTYTLELNPASDFSGIGFTSTTVNAFASVSGLSVNTTYYARVKATVLGSDSAWSVSAASGTLANTPNNGTWSAVTTNSLSINWSPNGNPAGTVYRVEVSSVAGFAGGLLTDQTNGGTSAFTNLVPGTVYYGRVKAVSYTGIETPFLTLTSTQTGQISPPANLAFTDSGITSLSASWSASVPGGDTYTLELNTQSNFLGVAVTSTTVGLSASLSGLTANTSYYARVKATGSGADSPWSASVASGTLANEPVSGTWSNVGAQTVTMNWGPNGNPAATHYRVEISSVAGFAGAVLGMQVDALAATFSGLVPVTVYYGRVKAVAHNGAETNYLLFSSTRTSVQSVPPQKPVIQSTGTVALSTSAIHWGWTANVPPGIDEIRFYGDGVDVSGALPPSATEYVQTGLLPNQAVSGRVDAANQAGPTASDALVRYTLARPPVNSAFAVVKDLSLTVSWSANGNQGAPVYDVEYSGNSLFTPSVTVQVATTSALLSNLEPSKQYFVRVRARNGDDIATTYDLTIATRTEALHNRALPAPVGGLWAKVTKVSPTTCSVDLSWDAVSSNVDGSAASSVSYIVKAQSSNLLPEDDWTETPVTGSSVTLTVTTDPPTYVSVRTVDAEGKQSPLTSMLRTSDQMWVVVADDRVSTYEYPMAAAEKMRASYAGNAGVSYVIQGNEMVEHLTNGRVVKSVRFKLYNAHTLAAVDRLSEPGRVTLGYSVENGQVVQGTPARRSYYSSLYAAGGMSNRLRSASLGAAATLQGLDHIGNPVSQSENLDSKLSLFWFNGAKWVKVGGTVTAGSQVVTYESSRLGDYQLRLAAKLGDLSLVQVYPRVFTPNGDGANDVVVFQFGELDDVSGVSVQGEIYDITGAKVGALKAGPDTRTLVWDGKSDGGSVVPSGIYVYQISVGGKTVNGTVVVAK